jgi:hypothetical protein
MLLIRQMDERIKELENLVHALRASKLGRRWRVYGLGELSAL